MHWSWAGAGALRLKLIDFEDPHGEPSNPLELAVQTVLLRKIVERNSDVRGESLELVDVDDTTFHIGGLKVRDIRPVLKPLTPSCQRPSTG